jgi:hypothetical protein
MALRKPQIEPQRDRRSPVPAHRQVRRWLIPIGGGLLSSALIVIATPHVPWFLRVGLAIIAFAYVSGQSASYLWSSDQG